MVRALTAVAVLFVFLSSALAERWINGNDGEKLMIGAKPEIESSACEDGLDIRVMVHVNPDGTVNKAERYAGNSISREFVGAKRPSQEAVQKTVDAARKLKFKPMPVGDKRIAFKSVIGFFCHL